MKLNLTGSATRRRLLATLVIVVVGIGCYLWLVRSEDPKFVLQAIGALLAVSLAAEEVIRLSSASHSFRRDEREPDA